MASSPTLPIPTASRLESPTLLRLWHLTSLDAPTVAMVWTLAFARGSHASLPAWLVLVVGLSAWAFYIGDRLLDARRASTPLRARHLFHWRHRLVFAPLGVAAAAGALALVLCNMPPRAEARDSLLAVAALAYFTGVHAGRRRKLLPTKWMPKELLVALVFTAACATPALSRSQHTGQLIPILAIFAALAWLNCHAIELWENQGDVENAAPAPAPGVAAARLSRRAAALAGVAMLGALASAAFSELRPALLLAAAALSAALLGSLDRHRQKLSPTALRVAADLVLLTPLALVGMR